MNRALLIALLLVGCGDDKPTDEDGPPPGVDPNLRIGQVMVEVGHRFEIAGRAAEAERWGLAHYEVHEILEMFEMDMTRAALPGDCDDTLSDSTYAALLETQLPALRDAAENEDADAFASQFRTVSASCNACHAGCQVAFVEVPGTPGSEVPRIADEETAAETETEIEGEEQIEGEVDIDIDTDIGTESRSGGAIR